MGPSPFLYVVHTITIGTMLNFNGGNNEHRLKNLTCKETLMQRLHWVLLMVCFHCPTPIPILIPMKMAIIIMCRTVCSKPIQFLCMYRF